MKAVIIDDEQKARRLLRLLLEENCPQITAIETAEDLPKGVALINEFQPDIVFLDIEMPGYSGIQLLEFFTPEQINFEVIFTTAYSEYAIKAFELNAIDYLLKPLRHDQLETAVQKAIQQIGQSKVSERLEELRNTLKVSNIRKIGLPVSNGVLFVELDDVIMMEADRMYTKVFTTGDGELLVSKPMKFFTDILEGVREFYRPHRSFVINLKHIKQYVNQDGGYIIMDNQKLVGISKDKKDEFFQVMQG
ncbi:MAG: LytTR family DNA-binding domain-containing protein [Marinoscillum sp.]|uniref:LytR/AlgR family response regulator transcription factor n=1 Tax=Marinoscillum sp. TaxID=2024838 RepID=UPI0033041F25